MLATFSGGDVLPRDVCSAFRPASYLFLFRVAFQPFVFVAIELTHWDFNSVAWSLPTNDTSSCTRCK